MSVEMALTGKQKRKLRALAHPLKPVVQIGQRGVTEAVALQVDTALGDHELIKVRLGAESPVDRREAADRLVSQSDCEVAGMIGRVLILYRRHPDSPRIQLDESAPETASEEADQSRIASDGTPARPRPTEEEPF